MKKKVVLMLVLALIVTALPITVLGNDGNANLRPLNFPLGVSATDARIVEIAFNAGILRTADDSLTEFWLELVLTGDNSYFDLATNDSVQITAGPGANAPLTGWLATYGGSISANVDFISENGRTLLLQFNGGYDISPPLLDGVSGSLNMRVPTIIFTNPTYIRGTIRREGTFIVGGGVTSQTFAGGTFANTRLDRTPAQPTITVGTQAGALLTESNSTVNFSITSQGIPAGSHSISVAGLPNGVTAPTSIAISEDGTGRLQLTGSSTAVAGTTRNLQLHVAGLPVSSNRFTLTITAAPNVGNQNNQNENEDADEDIDYEADEDDDAANDTDDQPSGLLTLPPVTPSAELMRFTIGSTSFTRLGVTMQSDVAPFMDVAADRAMIPLRIVSEGLGAEVYFDNETRTVHITKGDIEISLVIDVPLPGGMGTPVIINDRTFVPTRYISEILGATVRWDGAAQAVYVYSAS